MSEEGKACMHALHPSPLLHADSLQLMFQLNGEISSAMVSVDVERQAWLGHQLHFRSLAVDLPTGERLLLKGSDAAVVFQGYTRLR